jgi:hypothetical protein
MRKGTAAVWVGIVGVVTMGMSLLRHTHAVIAAKPRNAVTEEVRGEPSKERQQSLTGEPEQSQDLERTQTDIDEHIRPAAVRSMLTTALPSPPLPSRVLPGPLPNPEKAAPETQAHLLPTPPVPSKSPPGPIPVGTQDSTNALDETEPADPK